MGAELDNLLSVLAVFAVAAFRMLPCFNSISAYISNMLFEKSSVDAVYNDIIEMEKLGEKKHEVRKSEIIEFNHSITIQDLTYKYPETEKNILQDVSFEIFKNQSIGFMGESGAGKSTLIDIILGVLPISEGKICVDNVDIHENLSAWHNAVGYIPQSIYLMDDTIRNNVAFGIFEDEISDEQLWKALEEAQIADFVRELPDGLNTEIGDRGVRISGGQRQRLGIARALYHDPPILVFDEATSALDNETEKALMEAINGLKGKRTMLIIAHRLHTIENCDVIYEVKEGKVLRRDRLTT
jgi:ABC-type multidrug transport system fused ATPase/permease subunit